MKDLKLSLIVEALDKASAPLRKVGGALKELEERVHGAREKLEKIGLGEILGGAAAVAVAVEAGKSIFELTNKTAEYGEAVALGAKKTGIGIEAYQKISYAAAQLGVQQDALNSTFFRFENHLANGLKGNKETISALSQLGIAEKDLAELAKDPIEALARMQDGFAKITNPTQAAKLAMDLFGRSGAELLPLLRAGREEVAAFEARLVRSGKIITAEAAEQAEKYVHAKNEMGAAIEALQLKLGNLLIPTVTRVIDKITEFTEHMSPKALRAFAAGIESVVERVPSMLTGLGNVLQVVFILAGWFLAVASNATLLKIALGLLAALFAANFVVAMVEGAIALGKVAAALRLVKLLAIGDLFIQAAQAIYLFVAGAGALTPALGVATAAMTSLDVALDANPIGVIVIAIGLVIAAVAALAYGVYMLISHWKQVVGFFAGLWKGVVGVFASAWNGIVRIVSDAWARVEKLTPAWLMNLLKIGGVAIAATINPALGLSAAAAALAPPAAHGGPRAIGAVGAGAHRTDVHIHVTSDGRTQVRSVTASAGVSTSVSRGTFPQ